MWKSEAKKPTITKRKEEQQQKQVTQQWQELEKQKQKLRHLEAQIGAAEALLSSLESGGTLKHQLHQRRAILSHVDHLRERTETLRSEIESSELRARHRVGAESKVCRTRKRKRHHSTTPIAVPQNTIRRRKKKTDQHQHRVVSSIMAYEGARDSTEGGHNTFDGIFNDDEEPPLYIESTHICSECGGLMRRISREATLACTQCGLATTYINSTSMAASVDENRTYAQFSYKRQNHFREWLRSSQGKQSAKIEDDLLRDISVELQRNQVPCSQITHQMVRAILKKMRKRKHYENSVLICAMLTGENPPRFSPQVEQKLIDMFMSIQAPFKKAIEAVAPTRKNFLSYAFTCRKMVQLLIHHGDLDKKWLSSFQLLKGRDKLSKQDAIWAHICQQLGWTFFPSV